MKFLLVTLFLLSAVFFLPDFAHAGEVTFLSTQSSATDAASYTFSTVSIGDAAADRYIIGFCSILSTSRTITGVKINNVYLATTTITSIDTFQFVGVANVPLGTTGDLVVNHDNGANATSVSCDLYRVTQLADVAPNTHIRDATNGVSNLDLAPAVGAGNTAFIIGHAMQISSDSETGTWVGLTEQTDANTEAPNGLYHTTAFATFTVEGTVDISITPTNVNAQRGIAAAWEYTTAGAGAGGATVASSQIIWDEN